jgi:hypothetical protein
VRHLIAFAAVLVCALITASAVLAAEFGANDDGAEYAADSGESFYTAMAGVGLRQSVISVRWQPSDPTAIPNADRLDKVVPVAVRHGLKVVFAVYPYPPREIESGLATPAGFAAWIDGVAARYPQVRQYVVGNEPNQPAFWRPQFGASGRNVSAARFGAFLAAAYDTLKARDPGLKVIGVGLSPRGNDKPNALSNVSTSPVRFLTALGAWYRATGRTRPLMDGFSFHPYPNQATDSLGRGYPWPGAGFVNLGRIKQGLWDAFHETPQPTTVDGLKLYLDEVGWQVDTSYLLGYENIENVPVTDEITQAEVYAALVRQARCDPDVAEVNVFGFYDDPDRRGFQAALHRVDGTPRPAADAVRQALQEPLACSEAPWSPATSVVGARPPRIAADAKRIAVMPRVGEGVVVRVCAYPRTVILAVASRLPARAGGAAAVCTTSRVMPQRGMTIVIRRGTSIAGGGTIGVRVAAEANPERAATYAARFP